MSFVKGHIDPGGSPPNRSSAAREKCVRLTCNFSQCPGTPSSLYYLRGLPGPQPAPWLVSSFKLRLSAFTKSSAGWKETFDGQTPDNNRCILSCTTTSGSIRTSEQPNVSASQCTTTPGCIVPCEEHWPVHIPEESTERRSTAQGRKRVLRLSQRTNGNRSPGSTASN